MRTANMFGPDATFLGVPRADLEEESSYAGAGAVIVGAPFDGGTSHRPGCRFGPQAIRLTDYLPHDGSRPHLALGVDPLVELGVVDVGDVVMPPGDIELGLPTPRRGGGQDLGVGVGTRRPGRRPHDRAARRDGGRPLEGMGEGSRSSISTPTPTRATPSSDRSTATGPRCAA